MNAYNEIRAEIARSDLHEAKKKRLLAILYAINAYLGHDDTAYVDQRSLAAKANCGLTQVKKATLELEELGYLERIRTKRLTDGQYHWNAYRLIFPAAHQ